MKRPVRWLVLIPCLLGCGGGPASSNMATYSPGAGDATSDQDVPKVGAARAEEVTLPAAGRQIIYRAAIVIDVTDFSQTERQIAELIKSTGGFVSQFREERPYGAQRGGRWTVRVPVLQFDRFVEEAGKLGVAQSRDINSEDVSEEFVDLAARLKNKQQLEARLLELVAKRGDEIKDILALEAELSRVREEIERMQGRLRYLTDRVALTTVDLAAHERSVYVPPEAPTFAAQISQTWSDSLTGLQKLGEALTLLFVAISPWLVVLLTILLPCYWGRRRLFRKPSPPLATLA